MKIRSILIILTLLFFCSCSLNVPVSVDIDNSLLIPKDLALEYIEFRPRISNSKDNIRAMKENGIHWDNGSFYPYDKLNIQVWERFGSYVVNLHIQGTYKTDGNVWHIALIPSSDKTQLKKTVAALVSLGAIKEY